MNAWLQLAGLLLAYLAAGQLWLLVERWWQRRRERRALEMRKAWKGITLGEEGEPMKIDPLTGKPPEMPKARR
jgi:peptidoglycan/LPS O-acetylase OafA/YrhL